MTEQLAKLAKPFPSSLIHAAPQGKYGNYVEHSTVVQALLATVGPFDLRIVQVIRGDDGELSNVVVGIIGELSVTIDGRPTVVQEVGDCENPKNWKNDGARLKDATSDFIKRAAARIGLGLHLWAQGEYFLDKSLAAKPDPPTTKEE